MNDDVVYVSAALVGHIVGLRQESALRWRAHFFGVDLGSIEIIPSLGDVYSSDEAVNPPVNSIVTGARSSEQRTVNASDARPGPRKKKAVNA
jgi:hypothetical protein